MSGVAVAHAIVIDQEEAATFELDEVDGGIGVWERRILALAPRQAAVVGFRADDVADRPGIIIAAASAVGDQIIVTELHHRRLNIPLGRANRSSLGPDLRGRMETEK